MGCLVVVAELGQQPVLPRLELRPAPVAGLVAVGGGPGQWRRRTGPGTRPVHARGALTYRTEGA